MRHCRILGWVRADQCQGAGGGHEVYRVDVVFEQNGNTMERSAGALRASFLVQRLGDHQGIGVDLQDRAQGRTVAIERFDPIQVELDESSRAELI